MKSLERNFGIGQFRETLRWVILSSLRITYFGRFTLTVVVCMLYICGCGDGQKADGLAQKLSFEDHASKLSDVPGSYEWWNFFAEDAAGHLSVSAIFMSANLFDLNYRKAVYAWKANPESAPAPRPGDYWLLQINVSLNGEKIFSNIRRWPGHTAEFSRDKPRGRIGSSSFEAADESGGTVFRVSLDAPDITNNLRLKGDLEFKSSAPGFTPVGGMYGSMPGGSLHAWNFPLGLPEFSGKLRVVRRDGADEMSERQVSGRGYMDHMWGEGLLGDALKSWHFGTADRGSAGRVVYVWLVPAAAQADPFGYIFLITPGAMPRILPVESLTSISRAAGFFGLQYDSAYSLNTRAGDRLTVHIQTPLGEDWPFQVSGPSKLELYLSDSGEENLAGVTEYLLQSGIDDPNYETLFNLVDQMEWL